MAEDLDQRADDQDAHRHRAVWLLLWAAAIVYLGTGVFMALAPGSFAEHVAGYPRVDDHVIRDLGTWSLATGAALALAALRPAWRRPVLALAIVQGALHTANHVADVGDTDPGYLGPLNVAVVGGGTLALAYVWWAVRRERTR
jgi:hypothetical protein